jgi:2-polyprenyl-3-methyl-5-hydroxy-6-metoxy-1,4-benzoquinol methylase
MKTTSEQAREHYRERFYRHYLATHRGVDLEKARASLHASAPYLKKLIRRHIPEDRNARILDLGCGYGALLYWLRQAGYRNLEGIDRSPEQVQGAHNLGLDFVKKGNLVEDLESRDPASSDVVVAFDVVEHLTKEEALRFVDDVYRILVCGGRFIIHTPNGEGISSATAYGDFTHELTLTRGSASQLLRCAGFSHVSAYEDTPVVHGVTSAGRYLIWKAFRTFMRVGHAAETGQIGTDLILTQNFLTVAKK